MGLPFFEQIQKEVITCVLDPGDILSFFFILNIHIHYVSKSYMCFIHILIMDENRLGSKQNRSKSEPKLSEYLVGYKCLGSE